LFVFLSAVACGFLISFAGEGNSLRKAALPHVTFIFKQWIFIKVMTKFFLLYFPQKFIFSFLLSSPFLLLGCRLSAERMHGLHLKRILSILFISIFLFAFITFYIIVYLMSEMGPERAWTGISFFMSVMFATCFFVCGYYKVIRKRFAQNLFFTSMLLIVFSAPWYIYYQHKTVKKYSEAYDNRILLLENLKRSNFTGIHKLEPLLPSGLLHSNEISNDTSYFTNQQLKLFLDLPFAVSLKEP
jgi:small-conductance mechanosensitive channel